MALIFFVDTSGPVFDGRYEGIMFLYARRVEDKIGVEGVHRIREYLPTQYMYLGHNGGDPRSNPVPPNAGFLQSQIQTHRARRDLRLITSGDVIYGPWIEGIAVGNTFFWPGRVQRGLTPRFPGYHTFRKIAFDLQVEAADLATIELPPYISALNE